MRIKLVVDHHAIELDTPQEQWVDALEFEIDRIDDLMSQKKPIPFFDRRHWDSERQITVRDE